MHFKQLEYNQNYNNLAIIFRAMVDIIIALFRTYKQYYSSQWLNKKLVWYSSS